MIDDMRVLLGRPRCGLGDAIARHFALQMIKLIGLCIDQMCERIDFGGK